MALPSASEYIVSLGSAAKNHQQLLGYYNELYEFYGDKKPDNKYIYYLDENPYTAPAKTTGPETLKFFESKPLELSLLTPSIKIWRKKASIPF